MSPANRKAYDHYLSCKATLNFPKDPLVKWYSGIIRKVEDTFHLAKQDESNYTLATIATYLKVRAESGG